MTPQIVKKVPSLLHGAVGTFRLPWRSTAEAGGRAGGARRLRGGRAAAAPSPGGPGAAAGPRAPRHAHRGEQLGVGAAGPGEVQRGAADVLCCRHRGGWMVLHFVLGKVGKNCRETITAFSDHLRICHLYYRSAIMHEHVNFKQTISNHVMYGRAKTWTCQSLAKDVCKEQMPRCKFQSEMSEAVKAFLQKKTQNRCTLRLEFICIWKDWNDDDAHPNYVEMSTRRTLRFILQVLNYVCILHGTIVLDIFFISPNSRPLTSFLPFPHGTHRRIQACRPHTTGAILRCQAEALHRRALAVKEAQFGANHPSTLISMGNLAALLQQQGKLAEAGLRSLDGER